MSVYIVDENGETSGPFTNEEMHKMRAAGKITAETLCTTEGTSAWYPLREFKIREFVRPFRNNWKWVMGVILLLSAGYSGWRAYLSYNAKIHTEARLQREQEIKSQHVSEFTRAIAALKVACTGSTYDEFRQAQLNAKICFEANRSYLSKQSEVFGSVAFICEQVDYFWKEMMEYPDVPLSFGYSAEQAAHDLSRNTGNTGSSTSSPSWTNYDLLIRVESIDPAAAKRVLGKLGLSFEEQGNDRDFRKLTYAKEGLRIIEGKCESLLNQ